MNDRKTSLVLTALRYFQSQAIGDKPESMLTALTADRIDELCEKLNVAQSTKGKPRVIVVVEGGSVQNIFADRPLNADVLDHDNWDDTDLALDPDAWKRFDAMLKEIEGGKLLNQDY